MHWAVHHRSRGAPTQRRARSIHMADSPRQHGAGPQLPASRAQLLVVPSVRTEARTARDAAHRHVDGMPRVMLRRPHVRNKPAPLRRRLPPSTLCLRIPLLHRLAKEPSRNQTAMHYYRHILSTTVQIRCMRGLNWQLGHETRIRGVAASTRSGFRQRIRAARSDRASANAQLRS